MKKAVSFVLTAILAVSVLAGCTKDSDLSYAATGTLNGKTVKFPVGPYRFYVQWSHDYNYYYFSTMFAQYEQTFDWQTLLADTNFTNGTQTLGDSLIATAKEQYMSYLYIEETFKALGLTMTDDDWKEVDKVIQNDWVATYGNDGFNTIRQTLSMTYDEFRVLMSSNIKTRKIVDHYYGKGGESEISEDEKYEYFKNNYVRFKYVILMRTDSDGNALGTDALDALDLKREEILSKLDVGTAVFEDLIREYSDDYTEITDKMSDTEKAAAEKQNTTLLEDGLITDPDGVFDSNLALYYSITLEEAVVNKLFSLKDGDYAAVTVDDAIWIVKRYVNTEKESYFTNVSSSVFQALYADDFSTKHTRWRSDLNYAYNQAVVEAYKPSSLTQMFKYGS